MYAIIETGGKQYKVEAGDTVFIEKLNVEADAEITFDKVVAVGAEDGMKVGAPYVEGATVTAKAIKNGKAKRLLCSPISRRRTKSARWAIDSPIQRLKSPLSTRKR